MSTRPTSPVGRTPSSGLRLDTSAAAALRGIAILVIVLHNFLHVLPSSFGENEMDFDAARAVATLQAVAQEPASGLRHALSFLGHYGVQIFIFLSAYGLTRRFSARMPSYGRVLASRVARIYPLFLLSIALYLVRAGWSAGWLGPLQVLTSEWQALLLKVTLLSNFVPDQAFRPVGPWWFLPFIFQFYAVFPFLFAAHRRWGVTPLLALSASSVAIAVAGLPVPVMTTVIGHLPEFCLGLWLGSRDVVRVPRWLLATAVPLFVLGNLSQTFWYVSHLSALVLLLGLWELCGAALMRLSIARNPLGFLGGLALPLFLVNGFLRQPILGWAQAAASEARILGFAMLFLLVSIVVAWGLSQAERAIRGVVRLWLGRRARVALAS